jgi:hypothetical protein
MNMTKGIKAVLSVPMLFLGFGLIWAGCGDDSGSSSPPLTAITSVTQSENAASLSSQSASFAAGTGTTFLNMGTVGLAMLPFAPQFKAPSSMALTGGTAITARLSEKFAKSPAVASAIGSIKKAAGSRTSYTITDGGACQDFGSWSVSGSADDVAGTFNITLAYADCREYDTRIHGTYSLNGAASVNSMSMNMSLSNFSIAEYVPGSGYGTVVSSMTADIAFTGSMGVNASGTSLTMSMTGNGTMEATQGAVTYNMAFVNYGISDIYTPGASFDTDTITTNGRVSESWTLGPDTFGASIAYENFVVGIKTYLNWDEEITINGVYTIDFTPNACFEGRFSIQTTTPVYWNAVDSITTAGRLVVNSNTTIIFNADGTVTVQYNGMNIPGLINVPEVDLNGVCLIAAL